MYFQDPLHLGETALLPTPRYPLLFYRGKTSESADSSPVAWDGGRDVTTEKSMYLSAGSTHSSAETLSIAISKYVLRL